jgi:hypothetical protein
MSGRAQGVTMELLRGRRRVCSSLWCAYCGVFCAGYWLKMHSCEYGAPGRGCVKVERPGDMEFGFPL